MLAADGALPGQPMALIANFFWEGVSIGEKNNPTDFIGNGSGCIIFICSSMRPGFAVWLF
jgi:hypothetical protein